MLRLRENTNAITTVGAYLSSSFPKSSFFFAVSLSVAVIITQSAYAETKITPKELFELRTQCHDISEKFFSIQYKQHNQDYLMYENFYSVTKNKCFIKVTEDTDRLKASKTDVMQSVQIFDVQTNELLVYYWQLMNLEKIGFIYDKKASSKFKRNNYDDALSYGDELMEDNP